MRALYWLAALVIVGGVVPGGSKHPYAVADQASAEPNADKSAASSQAQGSNAGERAGSGLLALYDFSAASGPVVKDRSGVGEPVDLRIETIDAVRRSTGSLEVRGKTLIRSNRPAAKITDAIRRSGEITIEAWIRPAGKRLSGPARIVTLSGNSNGRHFTLGQDRDRFDVRFRTTKTNSNGLPSLRSSEASVTPERTHVVYTRDRSGRARLYVNGKPNVTRTVSGRTSNWKGSYRLALADEIGRGRPWKGTYYWVAVYGRSLRANEIRHRFKVGPEFPAPSEQVARTEPSPGARLFDTEVAPLLARHCLECHDSPTKKGRLDLSRKASALAGGRSGVVIVPGDLAESLLWETVEFDEMPKDRPPLSDREKDALRQWIAAGAPWTTDVIDPAAYTHDQRAGEIWLQRLTVSEYIETVRSTVGVDVAQDARRILPADLRADGFRNTAYNLNIDLGHVEAYADLAAIIVERMDVLEFAAPYAANQRLTDKNMRGLIAQMGKWVLRGPLDDHEIASLRGISTTVASAGGDFEDAVRYILEAMLQSPRFIYRIENQQGDGTAWPIGEYELASRLSYILWGGPPDRALMKAADTGELNDRDHVEAQVRRMLEDPRAVARSTQFISEWLNLDRLDTLRPNRDRFPHWDDSLATDMRDETLAFFRHVAWKESRPLADLLNAQVTFATPRLADHYGLDRKGAGLSRYDLSSVPGRGGLLTQGSVLTVGGDEASMVTRGLFVLHDLLRGVVRDPPPCVDTTPVPTKPGLTQRGIAEARIANKSCGGCHARFEPLAFGLEKFDGLGAHHESDEHGNKLRDDGEVLFPGEEKPISYETSAELMDLLADSERVRECLTWKVAQFALGRPLVAADVPILDKVRKAAQKGGGTYASLITAIVMSDLVQTTRTETSP